MILVNGLRQDSVPASDRGLNYGDGVFETIAVRDSRCLLWDAHLARLYDGLKRLRFAGIPDRRLIQDEAGTLAAEIGHGIVKIVVTRGSGERGYRVHGDESPNRVISAFPWNSSITTARETGVAVRVCELRLPPEPAALSGIKHLNRLPQVLARLEWAGEYEEGLLLDEQGRLIEGTMSNVFLVRDGALVTPDLRRCGMTGVMRAQLLRCAASLRMPLEVRDVPAQEMARASEVFLTNSVIGIWPVRRLDGTDLAAGPVTPALQSALHEQSPPVLA
jgi:4-amino-4-deoxychorismate lyase